MELESLCLHRFGVSSLGGSRFTSWQICSLRSQFVLLFFVVLVGVINCDFGVIFFLRDFGVIVTVLVKILWFAPIRIEDHSRSKYAQRFTILLMGDSRGFLKSMKVYDWRCRCSDVTSLFSEPSAIFRIAGLILRRSCF
jgi:hypothetical protein